MPLQPGVWGEAASEQRWPHSMMADAELGGTREEGFSPHVGPSQEGQ